MASTSRPSSAANWWGREVQDGRPEGGEAPDLNPSPPIYAPGVNAEGIAEIARRL